MSAYESFEIIFNNLMEKIPNIQATAVVDHDGLIIFSKLRNLETEDDIIGTITAVFGNFIERIKVDFGSAKEFLNVSTIDDKKFLFANAGENATLTILAEPQTKDAKLKVYGSHVAGKIKLILENETVDLEIPPIVEVVSNMRSGQFPKGKYQSKLIVVGDPSVGKTSLIRRFVDNKFAESYVSTIGVDISRKNIILDKDCSVGLALWDIAGQSQNMAPYRRRFYQGANLALIIFDITRSKTFNNILGWLEDINQILEKEIPLILIGNKNDLENHTVTEDQVAAMAAELNCPYLLTSAKSGSNVEEAFRYCAYKFCENI